jgi:hypothetical protein
MNYAAERDHMHVIHWLHENRTEGCTTWAFEAAARNNNLATLKWLSLNFIQMHL